MEVCPACHRHKDTEVIHHAITVAGGAYKVEYIRRCIYCGHVFDIWYQDKES
jgi:uncharacterized Zn finger protein